MLPMGTIMAVCMLVAVLFATRLPVLNTLQKIPTWLKRVVAFIVFAGGAWNFFWHSLQHLTEFWGMAAFVSGLLMMLTSVYIAGIKLPAWLELVRPIGLLVLTGYALLYGWKIYSL